ncbi:hypothetical protein BJ508DRAFT_332544 [Ascobolus immersus RN42]|uniref:Uncharacterized protein n=1 Tax=Ascobolus immersus RN42 TaxID=1160509 RepID=A0A3N4HMB4_ASCIM|nr:hypothetical protein BJ508DRAFT_332544 [Ascobolus immersus RN42]
MDPSLYPYPWVANLAMEHRRSSLRRRDAEERCYQSVQAIGSISNNLDVESEVSDADLEGDKVDNMDIDKAASDIEIPPIEAHLHQQPLTGDTDASHPDDPPAPQDSQNAPCFNENNLDVDNDIPPVEEHLHQQAPIDATQGIYPDDPPANLAPQESQNVRGLNASRSGNEAVSHHGNSLHG